MSLVDFILIIISLFCRVSTVVGPAIETEHHTLLYSYQPCNEEAGLYTHRESNCKMCGASHEKGGATSIIINGQGVTPVNKYPWMVALMYSRNNEQFCGGAILNQYFILTAAHCVKRQQAFSRQSGISCTSEHGYPTPCYLSPQEVQVGFLTPVLTEVSSGAPVDRIIPHPGFHITSGSAHDIALLKMLEPIECGPFISPICLPTGDIQLLEGFKSGISGWGSPDPPQQTHTKDLREALITVTSPDACIIHDPTFDSRASYCLKGQNHQSPCFGDSGGSMFHRFDDRFFAMGVASAHTNVLCDVNYPVIYTSVSAYVDWIQRHSSVIPTEFGSEDEVTKSTSESASEKKFFVRGKKMCFNITISRH